MKSDNKPHAPTWSKGLQHANKAPRCGAKTRRKTSCLGPAMPNGRCRLHGGKSTGPKTIEGLERSKKANWRHGRRSAEAIRQRKESMAVRRQLKKLINFVNTSD
jgi:hypothetical protein